MLSLLDNHIITYSCCLHNKCSHWILCWYKTMISVSVMTCIKEWREGWNCLLSPWSVSYCLLLDADTTTRQKKHKSYFYFSFFIGRRPTVVTSFACDELWQEAGRLRDQLLFSEHEQREGKGTRERREERREERLFVFVFCSGYTLLPWHFWDLIWVMSFIQTHWYVCKGLLGSVLILLDAE